MSWLRNPWGKPRCARGRHRALHRLVGACRSSSRSCSRSTTGRSRTTWQGFSFRWFTGSTGSVFHDPALQGGAQAHAAAGRDLRRGRDAARRLARARPPALARPGQRHRQHADAAAARDARDRDGRRAAAALPAGLPADRARHDGAGDRPGDVHALVRGRDRARPARRRSGPSTRRRRPTSARRRTTSCFRVLLPLLAPAIIASAAIVVRGLDRRLRRHAVPLERREHDDGLDAPLRDGPRRADPGAERDRDGRARDHARDARRSRSSSTGGSPAARKPPRSPRMEI